jgi:Protease inhibitor Inh
MKILYICFALRKDRDGFMIRILVTTACLASFSLLQGCDHISRFGDSIDPRSSSGAPVSSRSVSNAPTIISATPTPPVTSQPLPPPPPRFSPSVPVAPLPSAVSTPTIVPSVPQPTGLAAPLVGGVVAPVAGGLTPIPQTKIASVTPTSVKAQKIMPVQSAPQESVAPEKPSQSRLTGGWSVAQGSGSKCRLTLSNSPALDLYKAQTTGCGTGLTKVNAWELRGDEIYLYEQGGGVAARLKQTGNSSFNGSTAKSGAPVSISK